MQLAHPFFFNSTEHGGDANVAFCSNFVSTKDSAIEGGGECNTPVLTPLH